ncbi:MAG: hypothetical protein ACOZAO_03680 [Patescibacteria group bacterium]
MKILAVVIVLLLTFGLFTYFFKQTAEAPTLPMNNETVVDEEAEVIPQDAQNYPYKATFTIYTNGLERTFSNAMYLNQNDVVYIDSVNSKEVIVTEPNVTWQMFFDTLPFSLKKDCLVTGLGETFCNGDGGNLIFILNSKETPNALELAIEEGAILEVRFE